MNGTVSKMTKTPAKRMAEANGMKNNWNYRENILTRQRNNEKNDWNINWKKIDNNNLNK